MAEFMNVDLGRVMLTAEALKNSRRQAESDKLRDAYMGAQTTALQNSNQSFDAREKRTQETHDNEQTTFKARYKYLLADRAEALPAEERVGFIQQYAPELITDFDARFGEGAFMNQPPEQLQSILGQIKGHAAAQAGIVQPKAPVKWQSKPGPRGSIIQFNPETGEEKQVIGPDNSQPAAGGGARFRALTPQEIANYGLPAGSSAQINEATNQIQVLNKPSVAPRQSASERKAMSDAKAKLPQVDAALRRVDRLGEAVGAISKNWLFDGGPADAKALSMTEDGREVIAASAQLMPVLTALTRIPGVGSQSDLEQRLASLALPSNEFDPKTNRKSMEELRAFVQDLKVALEATANGDNFREVAEQEVSNDLSGLSDDDLLKALNGG